MIEAPTVTREEINPSHPINVGQHRDVPQIIWANCGEPKNINGFTCDGGPSSYREFKRTETAQVHKENANWWRDTLNYQDVFEAYINAGKEYYYCVDAPFGTTRSWPWFTGFSFELYNRNNGVNTHIYLRRIATKWLRPDGTMFRCAEYFDGSSGYSGKNEKYLVHKSWVNEYEEIPHLQLQRDGYIFAGFVFEYRCKPGGGNGVTQCQMWNMRFYTVVDDMPDNTRVVLPAMREFDNTIHPIGYGDQL